MPKHQSFADFMREVEAEAQSEGPEAVEELETFREYFRLAREMAAARQAKGLSQQELAAKCGVHQSEISDIERGRANPTFRTLQSIARRLDRRIVLMTLGPKDSRAPAKRSAVRASAGTAIRRKRSG